jgi:hypothetical protein
MALGDTYPLSDIAERSAIGLGQAPDVRSSPPRNALRHNLWLTDVIKPRPPAHALQGSTHLCFADLKTGPRFTAAAIASSRCI